MAKSIIRWIVVGGGVVRGWNCIHPEYIDSNNLFLR